MAEILQEVVDVFQLGTLNNIETIQKKAQQAIWHIHCSSGHYKIKTQKILTNLHDITDQRLLAFPNNSHEKHQLINKALVTEHISQHFQRLFLEPHFLSREMQAEVPSAICIPLPLTCHNAPYYLTEDNFVQVFPWLSGTALIPEQTTTQHYTLMAKLLALSHHAVLNSVCDQCQSLPIWQPQAQTLDIEQICRWQHDYQLGTLNAERLAHLFQQYHQAYPELDATRCISHGDWHQYNTIFHKHQLIGIIDWENAGRYHPLLDLLYVATNWSGIASDFFDLEAYHHFLTIYQKIRQVPIIIDEILLATSLWSWLDWLNQQTYALNTILTTLNNQQATPAVTTMEKVLQEIAIACRALKRLDDNFSCMLSKSCS